MPHELKATFTPSPDRAKTLARPQIPVAEAHHSAHRHYVIMRVDAYSAWQVLRSRAYGYDVEYSAPTREQCEAWCAEEEASEQAFLDSLPADIDF